MEYCQPSLLHARNSTTTTIPSDLIIDILSLLPAKSLIRFQSVSKLWFSTIRSKTFVASFLTRSETRPRLLFTRYHRESQKKFIFSASDHDNNYDDKTTSVMARYDMTIWDPDYYYYMICGSVKGFVVCFKSVVPLFHYCNTIPFSSTIIVHNLTTRQIVKLPDVTPNGRHMHARIGYDPVEDQYKVLCVMMFSLERENIQLEHFVCPVSSSQKQEWRKIENPTGDDYRCAYGEAHIDGTLYYGVDQSRIVRFDVRSEKIYFIKTPKESHISMSPYHSNIFNYCGKLGGLQCYFRSGLMTLWVLEDAEKQEWSSKTYDLPYQWEAILGVHAVTEGMTHTGDLLVFYPWVESSKPFYVCYYDFNKKSKRKVEIRGMEDVDFTRINSEMLCYPGHIENIMFL